MGNNIIDSSNPGIVIKETKVSLSDEKLKAALSNAYERAMKDVHEFKLRNHYSIFLSVAGTLFLSLLTSEFESIGKISAERITTVVWCVVFVAGVWGVILLGMYVSDKTQQDTNRRDKAVNEIFEKYIGQKS